MIDRRRFLAAAGVVGLTLSFPPTLRGGARAASHAFEPNAWLTIAPDGTITVHITKAEMGQGIGTALAQIVAEELEADWKDVRIDYPASDPKYGTMNTGGSRSVCIDETGYIQPTLRELVQVRGLESHYFNNAIQNWKVTTDGNVHNVHA